MSDDERKKKASEQDEDAEEKEQEGSDEADDEASAEEEGEQAAEEEGEQAEATDGDEEAAAQRVAAALGVSGEEAEAPAEKAEGEDEPAPVQNRAARRAEASQRRKKRKAAAAATTDGDEPADDLPKDKNARAKELLKRRREQAAAGPTRPVQLLPSEMVDDALARSASSVGKWIRKNFGVIQWVIVAAAVGGGGFLFYQSQVEKKVATASDALAAGVRADRGRVMAEDKRSDEEKEVDPLKVFKTSEERADTALASYRKVMGDSPGTGAAILARLGEAGALLDKHDYNGALEAYSTVVSSTLAGADPDVKARALEGLGFAKEGKKDLEGATSTFKELAGMAGYKELGQYHEARMLLAKGDKDKAKEILKQAYDALEKPSEVKANGYLKATVEDTLRRLDPSMVPQKAALGGGAKGGSMSQEDMDRAIKKIRENLEKQQREKEKHE